MAEAGVTLNAYRERLVDANVIGSPISPIKYMAFGDGGHRADLSVIPPDPEQLSLNNELMRVELESLTKDGRFSLTGMGIIKNEDLVGKAISEAALIDSNGDLVGIKNFSPKVKEADEYYETSITLRF